MTLEKSLRWTMRTILLTLALAGLFYYAMARERFYRATYAERSRVGAAWRTKGVTVAVVWPKHGDLSFVDGVRLAMEEANFSQSRRLNERIRLKIYEEAAEKPGQESGAIARELVRDGNLVAVLGHEISASAIPASLTYETHGILFLTPKSTDPRLTQHGFRYTFRLTPDDHQIAIAMVKFAAERAWLPKAQRPKSAAPVSVGLYFCRTPGGQSLSEEVIAAVEQEGLTLKFARSYLPVEKSWAEMDFRSLIANQTEEAVDTIVVADQLPRGAKIIADIRKLGVKLPIIASDKLDSGTLWDLAKEAANDVYVASAVDPDATTPQFLAFREQFRRRYGQLPGYGASQGYEAFMLLADAILSSDSAEPLIVATTIRNTNWNGLFGEFKFTPAGEIEGRHISIKRLNNGTFTTIPY
jgi:branched-chain amino acid transport system substrate-binding protein